MKLNLGCGKKLWDGFVNIDAVGSGAPVEADIRKLPYEDEAAEEIHAIHVFEHFYPKDVMAVLAEWKRVLQPGGLLVLELPCYDKVRLWIAQDGPQNLTLWALYGDPRTHNSEHDLHKWCWSAADLKDVIDHAGFEGIQLLEPLFHVKQRDMRLEARKHADTGRPEN